MRYHSSENHRDFSFKDLLKIIERDKVLHINFILFKIFNIKFWRRAFYLHIFSKKIFPLVNYLRSLKDFMCGTVEKLFLKIQEKSITILKNQ